MKKTLIFSSIIFTFTSIYATTTFNAFIKENNNYVIGNNGGGDVTPPEPEIPDEMFKTLDIDFPATDKRIPMTISELIYNYGIKSSKEPEQLYWRGTIDSPWYCDLSDSINTDASYNTDLFRERYDIGGWKHELLLEKNTEEGNMIGLIKLYPTSGRYSEIHIQMLDKPICDESTSSCVWETVRGIYKEKPPVDNDPTIGCIDYEEGKSYIEFNENVEEFTKSTYTWKGEYKGWVNLSVSGNLRKLPIDEKYEYYPSKFSKNISNGIYHTNVCRRLKGDN